MRKHILASMIALLVVALTVGLTMPSAVADSTAPYGNRVTARVADQLGGSHRIGWFATTLDIGACGTVYRGPRKAEIVKIPAGHGRRWVGIVHVTGAERVKKVRRTLACSAWSAQSGGRFVLPLRSSTWTDGGVRTTYRKTAIWAKKRLGAGWVVR